MTSSSTGQMNVAVIDTAFDPERRYRPGDIKSIFIRDIGDRRYYKVWLGLTGPDVPFVQSATYLLHPTFEQRLHIVPRTPANPNCTLIIWTWGVFEVEVTLQYTDRMPEIRTHQLTYDQTFEKQKFNIVADGDL